jgi:hypothetical protein
MSIRRTSTIKAWDQNLIYPRFKELGKLYVRLPFRANMVRMKEDYKCKVITKQSNANSAIFATGLSSSNVNSNTVE